MIETTERYEKTKHLLGKKIYCCATVKKFGITKINGNKGRTLCLSGVIILNDNIKLDHLWVQVSNNLSLNHGTVVIFSITLIKRKRGASSLKYDYCLEIQPKPTSFKILNLYKI